MYVAIASAGNVDPWELFANAHLSTSDRPSRGDHPTKGESVNS